LHIFTSRLHCVPHNFRSAFAALLPASPVISMSDTLTALSAIAASISAFAASVTVYVTVRAGVRNKKTDVLMECHRRFETLMVDRVPLVKQLASQLASSPEPNADLQIELRAWAQRFWSLQFDEYEWWQHGHVDTATYRYWMLSRYRDLGQAKRGSRFGKHAFIDGWDEVQKRWARPDQIKSDGQKNFIEFMGEILACASVAEVTLKVTQHKPGWRQRLGIA
jgi:hypothetical protein